MSDAQGNRPPQNKKHKANWFFFERFSWFDLIVIFICIQIMDWVLAHLNVGWT